MRENMKTRRRENGKVGKWEREKVAVEWKVAIWKSLLPSALGQNVMGSGEYNAGHYSA